MDHYKESKVSTNGMSEQHIFEVKQMWHSGFGASAIADELKLSVNQVLIAINQNEEIKATFTEKDFA
jgi:hypothetical protein